MGKSKRTSTLPRHAIPVPSPYALSSATAPLQVGRNVVVRPLTTPNGRAPPARKTPKKAHSSTPPPPRKVGLGQFGPAEEGGDGTSSATGIASWSGKVAAAAGKASGSALSASIAAVLNSRPARVVEQEDREKRTVLQKLRAEELRRELREEGAMDVFPVEDNSEEDDDYSSGDEGLDLSLARLLPGPPPYTSPTAPIVSSPLTHPPSFSSSSTPQHFPAFGPVNSQPNEISTSHEIELDDSDGDDGLRVTKMDEDEPEESLTSPLSTVHLTSSHSVTPSASTVNTALHAFAPPSPESDIPEVDLMEIDQIFSSPTQSTNSHPPAPTIRPSKPFATPSPPFVTPLTSFSPPSTTTSTPLKKASTLTQGRTRKLKPCKRAELFDYLSDDEDDWDELPSPLSLREKRPKHGLAVDGAGGGLGDNDPDLLPASKRMAERLCPMSYQSALLEKAKEGNVITVMATGSGKTLVAALLIEWMHTEVEAPRIAQGGSKKLTFFLTQSVPLVHQQARVLVGNTSLRVGKLFGALGVNLSNAEEWLYNFANYDCLVVTAQLLLDSLAHGFIDMSQIALLVFDECHAAKSNHPFASILRDFYARAAKDARPRILGLTASPLNSNEGLEEAERLQDLLDAKLVTAPAETLMELRLMVAAPTMLTVVYNRAPHYTATPLTRLIEDSVLVKDVAFHRCLNAARDVLAQHGPDARDLVWQLVYAQYEKKVASLSPIPEVPEDDFLVETDADSEFKLIHPEAAEQDAKMEEVKKETNLEDEGKIRLQLPEWLRVVQNYKPNIRFEQLSPKLQKLIEVLSAYDAASSTFCGIVFVNRRLDALLITQILRYFSKTMPSLGWLRVKCVTGHGSSRQSRASLGPRMEWAEQAEVLTEFWRGFSGGCNLLIATSVVEEGLNVQPCCFVARYDLFKTHISYVQSRGRARRAGSHYLLFVEKGNKSEEKKIMQIQKFDEEMDQLLHQVKAAYDEDFGDDFDFKDPNSFLLEPSTNALLTPHFSVSLLYRYCHSLPQSDAFATNAPQFEAQEYGGMVVCVVTLPASARVRRVSSPLCPAFKEAKRAASFMACKLLRHCEALDHRFLPVRIFDVSEIHDEEGRNVGSRGRQIVYERKLADAWTIQAPFGDASKLYGTILKYEGANGTMSVRGELYRPILLLSRNPLPATPNVKLFLDGQPFNIVPQPLPSPFLVDSQQREILRGYTLRVFTSVLSKTLEVSGDEVFYFVAAMLEGQRMDSPMDASALDWESMKRAVAVQEVQLDAKDLPDLEDSVVVDAGKNDCRYFFKALHRDLHPKSQLPPGRQSDAGFGNVLDYYMSFNEPLFHKIHVNMEQPLMEVTRFPRIVGYLTATPLNDVTPSPKKLLEHVPRFAMPQLCSRHSLPSSLFRTQFMLPSILTELDQLLLVQEFNSRVFNGRIDPALVRMALMTPSAGLEDNYERLELLGDAFLKYIASVYCFASLEKSSHEGDLHHERLKHIQNATLFKAGLELNLPAYLVSKPFTSRKFIPFNFEILSGQPPSHLSVIGDKTIADSVEALLGAAYETGFTNDGLRGGFELALEAALALKVDLKGVASWSDLARLYGPIEPTPHISERPIVIEQKLNRQFEHAHLLTEALTHPSKINAIASFQRLEWLGDSILDFLVIRYCWSRWGGMLPPGHLTELKGAMVSNETLSALAVELELDRYLAYDNPALTVCLKQYRARITKARESGVRAPHRGSPAPPKRLRSGCCQAKASTDSLRANGHRAEY